MKKPNPLPSKEELESLLKYNPATGQLYWRKRTESMFEAGQNRTAPHACAQWNSRFAGKEALVKENVGYRCGRLNYQYVLAHRVIWKMVTGEEAVEIDHIDGNRSNNRWENLRSVSSSENKMNSAKRRDNTSGVVGVAWNKRKGKWSATYMVKYKLKHVGFFDSFEDAVKARKAAELEHGFHANHGR